MYFHVDPNDGWIEVIVGCMFSGKTEEMVRRLRRAEIAKQNVLAFKPKRDNRDAPTIIKSHSGVSTTSVVVGSPMDLHDAAMVSNAKIIGIDEMQFFDPATLPDVVEDLARAGKRVILAGLDLDYRGMPFEGTVEMMAKADFLDKLSAVCTACGQRATRSQRITDSDERVLVGGSTSYEARCRRHWSPQPVFSKHGKMDHVED